MPVEVNIAFHIAAFLLGAAIGGFIPITHFIPIIPSTRAIPSTRTIPPTRAIPPDPLAASATSTPPATPVLSTRAVRRPVRALICGVCAVISWTAFLPLSPQAPPLLEANSTLASVIAPVLAPALAAALYFSVLCILLAIARIDADTMEIPNVLNVALLACGVLAIFIGPDVTLISRVIGMVCVSLPLLLFTVIVTDAFGGGDVKLLAAAGFLLGWQNVLLAAAVGILIGGVYGVYLLIARKKGAKDHFPFGPALCAGIAVALLFGNEVLASYFGTL